jgi:transposase-like protein
MDGSNDLARFCCQNPDCQLYGERDAKNLSVCGTFAANHHRLLYCNACKARFSEFKGTALFNSKLPHETVLQVLKHLGEGLGVRQISRLLGVHRDTVTRLAKRAGRHAKGTHDEWVGFSPRDPGSPARREMGVRSEEAEKLRPQRSRRR